MVSVSKILAVAALALGVTAKKHRVAMRFQPYQLRNCMGHEKFDSMVIKEGDCHHHRFSKKPYSSFELGPYHNFRKGHDVHKDLRDCGVVVYEEKHCKGAEWNSGSLHPESSEEKCYNVHFGSNTSLPRVAKAVRLHCAPAPRSRTTKAIGKSVHSTSKPTVSPWTSCASGLSTISIDTATETLTPPSSSSLTTTTTVESQTAEVTVETTTTIVAVPTATVQQTTTVWLPPSKTSETPASITPVPATSSTKAQRTRTIVEDVTARAALEAAKLKRDAIPTRAVVYRFPASASLECYASIDGAWYASLCPDDKPTAVARP